jgi:hypothetical protein
MSLESLPPIWEGWMYTDVESLTKKEIETLMASLRNKIDMVTDRYEYLLFYENREMFMQMKDRAYKYKDTIGERV